MYIHKLKQFAINSDVKSHWQVLHVITVIFLGCRVAVYITGEEVVDHWSRDHVTENWMAMKRDSIRMGWAKPIYKSLVRVVR